MSTIGDYFSCHHCGRQFQWKPLLAGKQGKCSCGQTVSIPLTINPENDESVYALADEEPVSVISVGRAVPARPPKPAALSYQAAVEADTPSLDLPTDLFIPFAVFLAAIATISLQVGSRPRFVVALIGLWVVFAITTLPGIAAFMFYGLLSSRQLKIPLASFCIAAFKILTIVLVADAVFFGLIDYLQYTDARLDMGEIFLTLIIFLVSIAAAVKISSLGFFHRKEDRFKAASFSASALAWIMHFLLTLMLYSIWVGFAGRRNARLAAMQPPPALSVIVGSGSSVTTIVTSNDRRIMQAAAQGMLVIEGRQWKNARLGKNPDLDTLIDNLYTNGAVKVYIDMRVGGFSHPGLAYVQLPENPGDRDKCLSLCGTYASLLGLPAPGPLMSPAPMFMQLQLRP